MLVAHAAGREAQVARLLVVVADTGRQVEPALLRVAAAAPGAPAGRDEADRREAEPILVVARDGDDAAVPRVEGPGLLLGVEDRGWTHGYSFGNGFRARLCLPRAVVRRVCWRSPNRGAWDAEELDLFFMGALRRPRGSRRLPPEELPKAASRRVGPAPRVRIAPARSAFFVQGLRDLAAVGSPHRTLALPEVSAQARSDASGHLPIRFQPSRAAPP